MRAFPVRSKPARRIAAVLGAAVALTLLLGPGLPGNSAASPSSADKFAQGDTSMVTTWTAPSEGTASTGELTAGVAVAPTQANLEFVSFSTGCRFLDTRISGGAFAADAARDLGVRDVNLPAGLGPCGVPNRAKAVQVSLSTIGGTPTGAGYARAGQGGTAPTATVLQFLAGQGISVTTNVTLNASGQIRLASLSAGAGYVGDLLGYFQEPLWGRVASNGTLSYGAGVASITKSASYAGDYYVYFDRTVGPGCAASVFVEDYNTRGLGYVSGTYLYVDLRNYATTDELDGTFEFVVQC